jgi:hypothetical protein
MQVIFEALEDETGKVFLAAEPSSYRSPDTAFVLAALDAFADEQQPEGVTP